MLIVDENLLISFISKIIYSDLFVRCNKKMTQCANYLCAAHNTFIYIHNKTEKTQLLLVVHALLL